VYVRKLYITDIGNQMKKETENREKVLSQSRKDSAEIAEEIPPKLIKIIQEIKKLLKKEIKK